MINEKHSFYGGEWIISPEGLFTFAHNYRHRSDKTEVILIGVNHVGEKNYYNGIRKKLLTCERVIFEGVKPRFRKMYYKICEDIDKYCARYANEADTKLEEASGAYYAALYKGLHLINEKDVFAQFEKRRAWSAGDEKFWFALLDNNKFKKFAAKELRWRRKMPLDYKEKLAEFFESSKCGHKIWQKSDLGEFYLAQIHPIIEKYGKYVVGLEREVLVMKRLKELLAKRPRRIGVKFGAGHISRLKTALEKIGFICLNNEAYCAFKF